MSKRLLIVTDSLGAPRTEPETVTYEQTWVYQVKKAFEERGYDVFPITQNGLHSSELLSLAETKLPLYHPDLAIIQCGVVDCAPRVLTDYEKLAVRILHIHKIVRYFAHKYHAVLSRWRDITLYKPEQFDEHMEKTRSLLNCTLIQIPIAPPCRAYEEKSPLIARNIRRFNQVLKKHSDIFLNEFADLSQKDAAEIFMTDHHHLNPSGHNLIAGIIIRQIPALIERNAA